MKKTKYLFLSLSLAGILSGCSQAAVSSSYENPSVSSQTPVSSENTSSSESPSSSETGATSNILVAYFSATGNTEKIAGYITDILSADSYEILNVDPYTTEDLNYGNSGCRANQEQEDESFRPVIDGSVENIEDYDTVFVGFPIWWGEEPRIIDTFMESYDFSGYTMVPFCTSGSTGITTAENNLHSFTGEETTWLDGRRFSSSASRDSIEEWIISLGFEY